jgi:hypothetical protein
MNRDDNSQRAVRALLTFAVVFALLMSLADAQVMSDDSTHGEMGIHQLPR